MVYLTTPDAEPISGQYFYAAGGDICIYPLPTSVGGGRAAGPGVPFGGFGDSGFGRENGIEAVHEYLATKSIWVELTGGTRDPFVMSLADARTPAAAPKLVAK